MVVELINTGSELMLGRVLNSHQQWLCRNLSDHGYIVSRQVAVPDTESDIEQVVREALGRADLVITTGGLGPTSDDRTRDRIAALLGRELREDAEVLAHIKIIFDRLKRPMLDRTRVQALVPEGAIVLHNAYGTAPGLALKVQPNPFRPGVSGSWLIMLPGPPRELRPMFADAVIPLLQRELPSSVPFVCTTLRTTGLGESIVEEKIAEPLAPLVASGLEVGYCARPGQVDVRLSARGSDAENLVRKAEAVVVPLLGRRIFANGDEDLARVIVKQFIERKKTLALAESCTGGLIAHELTNVSGASAVLLAGIVAYSNEAKQMFLGVQSQTIAQYGAVSEAVARQMAAGARERTRADYAVSVTGIAGPAGGTASKPVGTVFIGLAGPVDTLAEHYFNPYDRETFKQVTAQQALELLRRKTLYESQSG